MYDYLDLIPAGRGWSAGWSFAGGTPGQPQQVVAWLISSTVVNGHRLTSVQPLVNYLGSEPELHSADTGELVFDPDLARQLSRA